MGVEARSTFSSFSLSSEFEQRAPRVRVDVGMLGVKIVQHFGNFVTIDCRSSDPEGVCWGMAAQIFEANRWDK